ncbi:hypothetical protein N0V84_009041 [Fusarium piperis]|uniref:AAA+ ATPase domain-containing protein n=1 Tax=Fusarium piperis TaxID=1435070 RepID=A0A9W8W759_9HYPO|nr:hypothetical protein N0V84_009041 [Fusarium piperis]
MSHGDFHGTHQGLHDNLDREDSPSHKLIYHDNQDKIQAPEKKNIKNPNFGADLTVVTLYRSNLPGGVPQWANNPPKQISEGPVDASDRAAIKLFKIKDIEKVRANGEHPPKVCRLQVQNLGLVSALAPIVRKENVYLDPEDVATFDEPFQPLWFRHEEIVDLFSKKQNDPLEPFVKLFVTVLDELFRDLNAKTATLHWNGLTNFKTIWTLFPRGSSIYNYSINSEALGKVDSTQYGNDKLLIIYKTISFSGEDFYWKERNLVIPKFTGNKPIRELPGSPFKFRHDQDSITERLTARGKKALDLQGLTCHTYNGMAIHATVSVMPQNVNGRILIDVWGYHKYYLNVGQREKNDPAKEWVRDRPEDSSTDGQQQRLSAKDQAINKNYMLQKPEELAFITEFTSGFSLKNKQWFQSHSTNNDTSTTIQDVIVDKGQGLIVLLSGPPGTGKTLMAEAISDRLRRPLYCLTAEDLGAQTASLGASFKLVSEMAAAWNAIILLDDADVLVARRGHRDLYQNGLASAFLRELEYFRGIIFLTTNLPLHNIDPAFRSRVSMHLLFRPLEEEERKEVWRVFLNRLPQETRRTSEAAGTNTATNVDGTNENQGNIEEEDESDEQPLEDRDIAKLALWKLNGREIKIAIKTVHSWCRDKNYVMTLDRMERGIRVANPASEKRVIPDPNMNLYS